MESSSLDINPDVAIPSSEEAPRKTRARATRERAKQDKPPRSKPAAKPRSDVSTAAIEDGLAQILTLPSIPCSLIGDEWGKDHFLIQGRATAHVIAQASERNPVLRAWCERAMMGETTAVLLMAGVSYLLPPMLHWGVIPAPDGVKVLFNVPVEVDEEELAAHMNGNGSNESNG